MCGDYVKYCHPKDNNIGFVAVPEKNIVSFFYSFRGHLIAYNRRNYRKKDNILKMGF